MAPEMRVVTLNLALVCSAQAHHQLRRRRKEALVLAKGSGL